MFKVTVPDLTLTLTPSKWHKYMADEKKRQFAVSRQIKEAQKAIRWEEKLQRFREQMADLETLFRISETGELEFITSREDFSEKFYKLKGSLFGIRAPDIRLWIKRMLFELDDLDRPQELARAFERHINTLLDVETVDLDVVCAVLDLVKTRYLQLFTPEEFHKLKAKIDRIKNP